VLSLSIDDPTPDDDLAIFDDYADWDLDQDDAYEWANDEAEREHIERRMEERE
jgi:hypothetical protein